MFAYLLKVTICWLGFYLIYSFFLSKETFFKTNRWYLLGTLFLGAGIPLLEFLPFFQADNVAVVYLQPLSESVIYVQSAVNEAVTASDWGWEKLFLGVYIIGVLIATVRFFYGLSKIYALYRSAEISQKENHTLVLTSQAHLPFSFFKYLFWSKDFELDNPDGQKIITHEEAHVKGWHSVDVLLLEIFSIIFWPSPMVYFYKKSLKTVHEYLADAVVLQTTPTKKYGHLLLKQSQSGLQVALANHFFHSQLKQRIIMMTRSKSRKEAIVKYLFALPVILLLFVLFSKKDAMANTESTATEITETNEYENLKSISDAENFVFNDVDEMPIFPGCEEIKDSEEMRKCSDKKLLTYIYSNIKYPKAAQKANIQGMVVIKFVVKKDGTITKARIGKEIGGGCGAEALRVIQSLPNLIPAQKNGKAVDVEMVIPVKYKLADDDKAVRSSENWLKEGVDRIIIDNKGASEEELKALSPDEIATINIEKRFVAIEGIEEPVLTKILRVFTKKYKSPVVDNREKGIVYMVDGVEVTKEKALSIPESEINFQTESEATLTKGEKKVLVNLYLIETKGYEGGGEEGAVDNIEMVFTPPVKSDVQVTPDYYKVVDEMPRFYGVTCEQFSDEIEKKKCAEMEMLKFIYSNIKYPKAAADAGIQGRVIISFIIQEDGSLENVEVLRGIGGGCDEESARVVRAMPNFVPGKQAGKAVKVKYVLPVSFKLEGDPNTKMKISGNDLYLQGYFKNILYVLDGKTVDAEKVAKVAEEQIETLKVLMDDQLRAKYGQIENDAVVEITLKRNGAKMENRKNEALKLAYLKISPNPTNGKIDIEYESRDQPLTITVVDVTGKEIFRRRVIGGRSSLQNVDVSKAAKGILLVNFQQAGMTYTEKVILQ